MTSTDSSEPREASRPQGPPFFHNEALLRPELRAPVPLILNPKCGFQAVLRDFLIRFEAPGVTVEPAAQTCGAILFGCQEFIAGCHELLDSREPKTLRVASERILQACREFSGNLEGLYVLVQATEDASSRAQKADLDAGCSRLKNFGAPLEDFFHSDAISTGMDLDRLGLLQVHLDEVYDQACRQLERFYLILARGRDSQPAVFAAFARALHHDVFRLIVPDHIFDPIKNAPAGGEDRTGLLDLLPELEESVKAG